MESAFVKVQWIQSDIALANISGDLTLETAPKIRRQLVKLAAKKVNRLLVNLTDLSVIDSAGIAVLIELLRTVSAKGGQLKIIGLHERLSQIIRLMRLDSLLTVYPTVEEALGTDA